jgi:hypothetical protein
LPNTIEIDEYQGALKSGSAQKLALSFYTDRLFASSSGTVQKIAESKRVAAVEYGIRPPLPLPGGLTKIIGKPAPAVTHLQPRHYPQ